MKIGIVGATGLIGSTLLKIMEENNIEFDELRLIASKNSIFKKINYRNCLYQVFDLAKEDFKGLDVVFFCVNAELAWKYVPKALEKGCYVIDNSSAFRQDERAKLVISGVNDNIIKMNDFLLVNPNCSTIQSILCLAVLYREFGITSIDYTTFQAVSGMGYKGINELRESHSSQKPQVLPVNISKTCLPVIGCINDVGNTSEESKMIMETKKLLNDEKLHVTATCVRVPICNGHGVSIKVRFKTLTTVENVENCLKGSPFLQVLPQNHISGPTSEMVDGQNQVVVGRIRQSEDDQHTFLLYTCADNLRVGAALNAWRIYQSLIQLAIFDKND